jgi:hypothetical protein
MHNSPALRELPNCLRPDKAGERWNEPLDVRDLTTRLETEGVTDVIARTHFGFPDTWSMADAWLPKILDYPKQPPAVPAPLKGWREYGKGISFALPLLASCLSILVLGFSLWGGDLSAGEATAVGLGTIASFLITGGFVQVMARRGMFLASTKQFRRCEESTWWWFRSGGSVLIAATAMLLTASAYWNWLPLRLNLVAAGFCVALGFFWLAAGILHILDGGLIIFAVTVAGIALVAVCHSGLHVGLIPAQLISIFIAGICAAAIAAARLRRNRELSSTAMPSTRWRDFLLLWPYFVYGTLYYFLLFTDRLVAWTAHTHASAFIVQFRGDYESALNLGLLAFVFQVGWVQYSVAVFYRELAIAERGFAIDRASLFRRAMVRFYWLRTARFMPLGLAISALPMLLAQRVLADPVVWTARWSVIGFPFVVIGLWNVSLLFGLSQPSRAVAAAGIASLVDLTAGYLLSRLSSPQDAVIGFLLGAITFAGISGYSALSALRRADYAHYAASQ